GRGGLLVGCGPAFTRLQSGASSGEPASSSVLPVTVACEPNQRVIVRQVVVNGVAQAQAECQSVAAVGTTGTFAEVAQPVGYSQAAIPETRLIRTTSSEPVVTRQSAPRRVAYQSAPERRGVGERPNRGAAERALLTG